MNWDSHYTEWQAARAGRHNAQAHRIVEAARKQISEDRVHGWTWCREGLKDRQRKWFVAALFEYQPVPRRLFQPMLDAAVVDVDASSNRLFIEPCVETFGNVAVVGALTAMKGFRSGLRATDQDGPLLGERASGENAGDSSESNCQLAPGRTCTEETCAIMHERRTAIRQFFRRHLVSH